MILAIIVTYNPEMIRLEKNINSIINQVDKILLIDNNSKNLKEIEKKFSKSKIEIVKNLSNLGIASALNIGLRYSKIKGYKYILTLDQDSISTDKMIKNLREGFKEKKEVAIVSPTIYDLNLKKNSTKYIENEYEEVLVTITSGSLCKSSILNEIGGFDERLFIDYVDFEVCLRLKKLGYKVLLSKNAILNHEVGKSDIKNVLGMKFIITNHSSFRCYYMFRNSIYVNNIYNKRFSKEWIKENLKLIKKTMGILIWEKNKKEKFFQIIKGIKSKDLIKIKRTN